MPTEKIIEVKDIQLKGMVQNFSIEKNGRSYLKFLHLYTTEEKSIKVLLPSLYYSRITPFLKENASYYFQLKTYQSENETRYKWVACTPCGIVRDGIL